MKLGANHTCCQRLAFNSRRRSGSVTHLAAGPYPLVHVVDEGLADHVASGPGGGVEVALVQDDLPLADHHQGPPAHLHPLQDVVLHRLRAKEHSEWCLTDLSPSPTGSGR